MVITDFWSRTSVDHQQIGTRLERYSEKNIFSLFSL